MLGLKSEYESSINLGVTFASHVGRSATLRNGYEFVEKRYTCVATPAPAYYWGPFKGRKRQGAGGRR